MKYSPYPLAVMKARTVRSTSHPEIFRPEETAERTVATPRSRASAHYIEDFPLSWGWLADTADPCDVVKNTFRRVLFHPNIEENEISVLNR